MTDDNPFDKASRTLAKVDAAAFTRWAVGTGRFRGWLDTRTLPRSGESDLVCDTVAWVENEQRGGEPWLLVLEFQLDPDPDMLSRLFSYFGRFGRELRPGTNRGDRFVPMAVVVNLRGRGRSRLDADWPEANMRWHQAIRDIDVGGMDAGATLAGIERGELPGVLLPLIPLMKSGDDAGVMTRWLAEADKADRRQRSEYKWITLVFAEAAGCEEAWSELLEGWDVIRSKVVDKWIEGGRVEGRVEGIAEGEAHGTAKMLVRVLESKFGTLPQATADAIRATADLAALESYSDAAFDAASLDEFRAATRLP